MTKAARIGLLGGTFDPPHIAHLAIARAALDALALDEVRFIVAAQPWQKKDVSDAAHRVAMVKLAIADEPRFTLDTRELARAGPSYTIDTLQEIRASEGGEAVLVLILGSDQYRNLPSWHRHAELDRYADIAVAHRGGDELAAALPSVAPLVQPYGQHVMFTMPELHVSASMIRTMLRRGETPQALVSPCVLTYIRSHHLYTAPE
ncbi:MAG TPA: nicotinate (nicotinamide) nucleotide adenylyltransferase [Burkholderiaceae bacterium]|nr:nicotinate (nicotinamide) nucleotide adenylyltransferase [Burkholderiaceae bacterium]